MTVTGEAPLLDVTSSVVSGNVDRRQMDQLPIQGRNWMELSMMVKGITANSVTVQPGVSNDDFFQLNLDGQQITQKLASSSFGQPAFSRDAIAEFQIATSSSISRRAARRASRSMRSRNPAPTPLREASMVSFATMRSTPPDPVSHHGAAVLRSADRRHARRSDRPGQAALLRVVRVRAQSQHDLLGAGRARW